jgi:release factor glutamine methyltransferase
MAAAVPNPSDGTVRGLIGAAASRLTATSETPRLDAEALLAHCSGIGRTAQLTWPERALGPSQVAAFAAAVDRRADGEPVAYITGQREFFSLALAVTPAVLVPRPETELVVDAAADLIAGRACRVADLGTGCGAIALALKQCCPAAAVTATDIDPAALAVAAANAAALGLDVTFVQSSWFAALGQARFDILVSNPPYVASGDAHFDGPLRHEPRLALDGGADGLDAYRRILDGARRHLAVAGSIVLEHGYDQRESVGRLAADRGYEQVAAIDDLGGRPRVLVLRAPEAR